MRALVQIVVVIAVWIGWLAPALCEPQTQSAGKAAAAPTKAEWRSDLRYFASELEKRHKNLFHTVQRETFERAVAQLDAAIPTLADHQIVMGMKRIAAMVGDGHTGVHLPLDWKRYPVNLYWFGPDLRVIAVAGPEYRSLLGGRVVTIEGMDIAEVQERVATCFPSAANENEWYVLGSSPAFLVRPEVLHALGVVPDLGPATFTVEGDQGGQRISADVAPIAFDPQSTSPWIRVAESEPLMRQRPAERFWFVNVDPRTVYVSFRGYDSLGKNARELFAFLDANPAVDRVVVDLRQNGGGDFFEGRRHLVEPLQERPAINQKGHLFVVVGRHTFSAAMVNAIDFREQTNAILVGEPIGERPNSYSENDEMTLPKSRVVVSYSTRYYEFVEEDVPAVLPDHRIDPDWESYRSGIDPVMKWILGGAEL